jgi:hypothetical protein
MLTLLGAMFGFFWDMLDVRRRVLEETARRRAAQMLIERIDRDLMTAIVGDSTVGAGIAGDATSLRILTRSVPVRLAQRPDGPGEPFADLERSEYTFDASDKQITAARALATVSSGSIESFPLGGQVSKLRFRFHDGTSWVDSFDSLRADRLPVAVEIAVWFDPWPNEIEEEQPDDAVSGMGEEAEPWFAERATFDAEAGFDEREFALASDIEMFDEPRPDRIAVIVIPDAAEPDGGNGSGDGAFTDTEALP